MGEILTLSFILTGWYGVYKFRSRTTETVYFDDHEPTNQEIRQSPEYRQLRITVLKRDNFKCVFCDESKSLEVHHMYSFASFPELRFDPNNCLTLCQYHHKLTPNYGSKEKAFSEQLKSQ